MSETYVPSVPVLPVVLVRMIDAAACTAPAGRAEALAEFGRLALVLVPSAGVLDLESDETAMRVQSIAARHLGFDKARDDFYRALERLPETYDDERDVLESAFIEAQAASDAAQRLFGLALGVTFAMFTGMSANGGSSASR